MTNNPAGQYAKLRSETMKTLGFDADKDLSPLQDLQINLASILLLEIDSAQGAQLAGTPVDLSRLNTAISLLHKMLPATSLAASPEPDFAGARERLAAMLTQQHDGHETGLARWPDKARADLEERIKLAIAAHPDIVPTAFPSGAAIDEPLIHPALRSSSSAAEQPPPSRATSETISAAPETQQSPQPPLPPSSAPPAHYLRRDDGFNVIQGGRDRWRNNG